MKTSKKVLPTLLTAAVLFSVNTGVMAFAPSDFLHVPRIKQTYPASSCWAAAGASVATHLGRSTSESQFAQAANQALTQTATMSTTIKGFTTLGIGCSSHDRLNFVDYKNEIYYSRKPVYIQLYRHAAVGDGYRTYNGTDEVLIMDPADGAVSYYDYNELSSGEGYYWWIGSLKY